MRKTVALLSLMLATSMLSSTVFASDLVGLRAARQALFARENISREEANALHTISLKILQEEAVAIRNVKEPQESSKYPEVSQINALKKEEFQLIMSLTIPRKEALVNQLAQIRMQLESLENHLIGKVLSDIYGNN